MKRDTPFLRSERWLAPVINHVCVHEFRPSPVTAWFPYFCIKSTFGHHLGCLFYGVELQPFDNFYSYGSPP